MEDQKEPKFASELKQAHRRAAIIGIVLIVGLFLYAYVMFIIVREFAPFTGFVVLPIIDFLRYVLLAMVVVQLLVTRLIQKSILASKALAHAMIFQRQPFSQPIQKLFNASTFALAMCEAIAIYGLVLFLMAGNTSDYFIFAALSLFGFAVYFPRYRQWEQRVEQQER